jgi:hypothetical protein
MHAFTFLIMPLNILNIISYLKKEIKTFHSKDVSMLMFFVHSNDYALVHEIRVSLLSSSYLENIPMLMCFLGAL